MNIPSIFTLTLFLFKYVNQFGCIHNYIMDLFKNKGQKGSTNWLPNNPFAQFGGSSTSTGSHSNLFSFNNSDRQKYNANSIFHQNSKANIYPRPATAEPIIMNQDWTTLNASKKTEDQILEGEENEKKIEPKQMKMKRSKKGRRAKNNNKQKQSEIKQNKAQGKQSESEAYEDPFESKYYKSHQLNDTQNQSKKETQRNRLLPPDLGDENDEDDGEMIQIQKEDSVIRQIEQTWKDNCFRKKKIDDRQKQNPFKSTHNPFSNIKNKQNNQKNDGNIGKKVPIQTYNCAGNNDNNNIFAMNNQRFAQNNNSNLNMANFNCGTNIPNINTNTNMNSYDYAYGNATNNTNRNNNAINVLRNPYSNSNQNYNSFNNNNPFSNHNPPYQPTNNPSNNLSNINSYSNNSNNSNNNNNNPNTKINPNTNPNTNTSSYNLVNNNSRNNNNPNSSSCNLFNNINYKNNNNNIKNINNNDNNNHQYSNISAQSNNFNNVSNLRNGPPLNKNPFHQYTNTNNNNFMNRNIFDNSQHTTTNNPFDASNHPCASNPFTKNNHSYTKNPFAQPILPQSKPNRLNNDIFAPNNPTQAPSQKNYSFMDLQKRVIRLEQQNKQLKQKYLWIEGHAQELKVKQKNNQGMHQFFYSQFFNYTNKARSVQEKMEDMEAKLESMSTFVRELIHYANNNKKQSQKSKKKSHKYNLNTMENSAQVKQQQTKQCKQFDIVCKKFQQQPPSQSYSRQQSSDESQCSSSCTCSCCDQDVSLVQPSREEFVNQQPKFNKNQAKKERKSSKKLNKQVNKSKTSDCKKNNLMQMLRQTHTMIKANHQQHSQLLNQLRDVALKQAIKTQNMEKSMMNNIQKLLENTELKKRQVNMYGQINKKIDNYEINYYYGHKDTLNNYLKDLRIENKFGKIQFLQEVPQKAFDLFFLSTNIQNYVKISQNKCQILQSSWQNCPMQITVNNFFGQSSHQEKSDEDIDQKLKEYYLSFNPEKKAYNHENDHLQMWTNIKQTSQIRL